MIFYFYQNYRTKTWNGFHLIAVDGSKIFLPKNEEITQHFGDIIYKYGESVIIANASQIFDCLNEITIDAIISPGKVGERELLEMQIHCLNKDDLLLMDRGYPAFWLFALLIKKGVNFCARIGMNSWKIVREFSNSNEFERIITVNPSFKSKQHCKNQGISVEALTLRLVKIELSSGHTEILVTTLIDDKIYDHNIFEDLYHLRWPVEEDYKIMKLRIEIENFSGKSVESIYQDFHAKVFTKNLTTILKTGMQDQVNEKCKKRKYQYKINSTNALCKMKNNIVLLFTKKNYLNILSQLLKLLASEIEAVRKNRKCVRRKNPPKRFFPQYKPIT